MLPVRCRAKYEQHIDTIRAIAREHGYAIGVHGSLARDIDLIAAPWTDEASDGATLAGAIADAVSGFIDMGSVPGRGPSDDYKKPEAKPHGRFSWSIHLGGGPYIDLTVMPRVRPEVATVAPTTTGDAAGLWLFESILLDTFTDVTAAQIAAMNINAAFSEWLTVRGEGVCVMRIFNKCLWHRWRKPSTNRYVERAIVRKFRSCVATKPGILYFCLDCGAKKVSTFGFEWEVVRNRDDNDAAR